MGLSYTARRRWSLVILLVGMPVYVVLAVTLVGLLERPPIWAELLIYVALGFLWMMPFKFIFKGVGQPDPKTEKAEGKPPSA
jgi:Protein of unknown function (DUF2842)